MKKLTTLLVMLLFTAGMAIGQNTTDISQVGSQGNSSAEVTQENGSDNSAEIEQNSRFLNAAVTNETGRLGHVTEINQDGTGNISEVTQSQNQAGVFINQINIDNETRISQAGYSTANVTQDGDRNIVGSFSNPTGAASSEQNSSSFPGDANFLDVTQIGNDNIVGVDQRDNTDTDINITGNNNEVLVDQFEIAGDLDMANITVTDGDDNRALVTQAGGGNSFTLSQMDGDFNQARVEQSNGSTADIVQEGSYNVLQGNTGASSVARSLDGSYLDVDQLGGNNTITLDQTNGASSVIYQNGNENTSIVTQN